MARFDLNGNPLPDDTPGATPAGQPQGTGGAGYGAPSVPPRAGETSGSANLPYGGGPYATAAPPPPRAVQGMPPPVLPGGGGRSANAGTIVAGLVGVAVVAAVGWVVYASIHPAPVPAPSGYHSYALDGGMSIDQPNGWTAMPIDKSQGSEAVKISGGAVFMNRTASIEIAEGTPLDPTATSAEYIAQLSNSMSSTPADMAAMRYRRLAKNHLWGYHEGATEYNLNAKAFKYAEKSPFTASNVAWRLGGPIQGYLVTEATAAQCVTIVCECRASDWPTLQPVFDHVIDSLDNPSYREELEEEEKAKNLFSKAPESGSSAVPADTGGNVGSDAGTTGSTGF